MEINANEITFNVSSIFLNGLLLVALAFQAVVSFVGLIIS
jgi:hypothetical protein